MASWNEWIVDRWVTNLWQNGWIGEQMDSQYTDGSSSWVREDSRLTSLRLKPQHHDHQSIRLAASSKSSQSWIIQDVQQQRLTDQMKNMMSVDQPLSLSLNISIYPSICRPFYGTLSAATFFARFLWRNNVVVDWQHVILSSNHPLSSIHFVRTMLSFISRNEQVKWLMIDREKNSSRQQQQNEGRYGWQPSIHSRAIIQSAVIISLSLAFKVRVETSWWCTR